MFILCANTEEEYYALEELHDSIGIITDNHVYFVINSNDPNLCIEQDRQYVYFPSIKIEKYFPDKIEAQIEGECLHVRTNILGWIVHTLSRYEEYGKHVYQQGRMPLKEALAYKQGIYQTAYLDRLIAQFKKYFITYLDSQGISWKQILPSNKPLICLTHDVDSIQGKSYIRYFYWLVNALLSFKISRITEAINRIKLFVSLDSDPDFSFQNCYEIEKSCGFRSTFFIMSLQFFLGREGRRYSLSCSDLKDALLKLKKCGWEIALHPSRATHLSKVKLRKEINRLRHFMRDNFCPLGIRNHYLKASFPETWRIQEKLGIQYDSSLGWSESPGFRSGTARPFRPFDCELNRRLDLWELPLIVMDGTLKGSVSDIVKDCTQMAEEAFRYDNPFTLLWHSDRISPTEYPEFSGAYPKILQYFNETNCVGFTASEIVGIYQEYSDKIGKYRKRRSQ